MTVLRRTPARRALLQAIADGAVTEEWDIGTQSVYALWNQGPRARRVTAAADQLRKAGVAEPGPNDFRVRWVLTPVGEELLRQWSAGAS